MEKILKKKKGFTLIELIIVMAILGILALIAIPKFGQARKDAKANADFATAKTIADNAATLLASEKIINTAKTGAPMSILIDGSGDGAEIEKRLNNSEKTKTPQAAPNDKFQVNVDEKGDVSVTIKVGTNIFELYPKQDKGYPETPQFKSDDMTIKGIK